MLEELVEEDSMVPVGNDVDDVEVVESERSRMKNSPLGLLSPNWAD
jgi:hypothetical protein